MYNKTKHLIGLIGSICAIVLGGLLLLCEVYNIVLMAKYDRLFSKWQFLYMFFSMILRMTIGGMFLAFGASSLSKPTLFTSAQFGSFWLYSPRNKTIGLIVLGTIKCVGGIISVILIDIVATIIGKSPYVIELERVDTLVQYCNIALGAIIVICKVLPFFLKDKPIQMEAVENGTEEI